MKTKKKKWCEGMGWRHIILEGYCMYNSSRKKMVTFVEMDNKKRIRMKNPLYMMNEKVPKECKKGVGSNCLYIHCPFFSYVDAEESDYRYLDRKYKKK